MQIILDDKERIMSFNREHPILLFGKLLAWLVIVIIPFMAEEFLKLYVPLLSQQEAFQLWLLLKDLYLLLALMGLLIIITFYHLNVHVVTNQRVIDIDQYALLRHHTTELHMNRIQHVTATVSGFWGNLFNYGNVDVESAGEDSNITFENVANPKNIKRLILDHHYTGLRDQNP